MAFWVRTTLLLSHFLLLVTSQVLDYAKSSMVLMAPGSLQSQGVYGRNDRRQVSELNVDRRPVYADNNPISTSIVDGRPVYPDNSPISTLNGDGRPVYLDNNPISTSNVDVRPVNPDNNNLISTLNVDGRPVYPYNNPISTSNVNRRPVYPDNNPISTLNVDGRPVNLDNNLISTLNVGGRPVYPDNNPISTLNVDGRPVYLDNSPISTLNVDGRPVYIDNNPTSTLNVDGRPVYPDNNPTSTLNVDGRPVYPDNNPISTLNADGRPVYLDNNLISTLNVDGRPVYLDNNPISTLNVDGRPVYIDNNPTSTLNVDGRPVYLDNNPISTLNVDGRPVYLDNNPISTLNVDRRTAYLDNNPISTLNVDRRPVYPDNNPISAVYVDSRPVPKGNVDIRPIYSYIPQMFAVNADGIPAYQYNTHISDKHLPNGFLQHPMILDSTMGHIGQTMYSPHLTDQMIMDNAKKGFGTKHFAREILSLDLGIAANQKLYSPRHNSVTSHSWAYRYPFGPSQWQTNYNFCSGTRQSPINIDDRNVIYTPDLSEFVFRGFNGTGSNFTIKNNGHTASISVKGPVYVENGGFGDKYETSEIHFHWGSNNTMGSEHAVNGRKFPLEMHIVNFAIKYETLANAMKWRDGLGVLGIFFELGAPNPAFKLIEEYLKRILLPGSSVNIGSFNLLGLLPIDTGRYYRYYGSLTTPPCYQSVLWTIFEDRQTISVSQLNSLRQLYETTKAHRIANGQLQHPLFVNLDGDLTLANNFRPLQPEFGRIINTNIRRYSDPSFIRAMGALPFQSRIVTSAANVVNPAVPPQQHPGTKAASSPIQNSVVVPPKPVLPVPQPTSPAPARASVQLLTAGPSAIERQPLHVQKPSNRATVPIHIPRQNAVVRKQQIPQHTWQPRQQILQQPNQQTLQQPNQQTLQQPNQQTLQQPNQQTLQQPNQQTLQQPNQQTLQQHRQTLQQQRQQTLQQHRQQTLQQQQQKQQHQRLTQTRNQRPAGIIRPVHVLPNKPQVRFEDPNTFAAQQTMANPGPLRVSEPYLVSYGSDVQRANAAMIEAYLGALRRSHPDKVPALEKARGIYGDEKLLDYLLRQYGQLTRSTV